MDCEYLDDCRNANNDIKCGKCEHNPNNWQKIEKDENGPVMLKPSSKKFYMFRDNYEPL